MPIAWSGDGSNADALRIERNLAGLLSRIQREAADRSLPTVTMAVKWHRAVFEGVPIPVQYFAGGIRDSNPEEPELVDYEVSVGGPIARAPAVAAAKVPEELATFEVELRRRVTEMDARRSGEAQVGSPSDGKVFELIAWVHGEWVRIHPFVNGNGRVARIWANWVALRYGLPAFVRLRPRPAGLTYASASERSMTGDHRLMELELYRLFAVYLSVGSPA